MNHPAQIRSDAVMKPRSPAPETGKAPITAEERDFWRRAVHEQRLRLAAGLDADDASGGDFN